MALDTAIDITAAERETILALLQQHLPGTVAWVYGSRVKGTSTPKSDLDLVVFAPPEQRQQVGDLREAFEESNLPFRVDLFVWNDVPDSFRMGIEAGHVVLSRVPTQLGSQNSRTATGWTAIDLGSACTKIGSGATPRGGKGVYTSDGPYSLIRSQNVFNDGFRRDGLAYISERHASELSNVEVMDDDVLLNITGDSVARACQVDAAVLPARVNQHVAIIRPHPEKLDPRFLRYYLVSPELQAKLLSWAGSGGTRNALTKAMIESLDVLAPQDTREQHAIAHILGTLDDKIELNRRMNATLEAMARALFKSWFVDFDPVRAKTEGRDTGLPKDIADLFPDRLVDSELGEIPDRWDVATLGDHVVNFDSKRIPVSGAVRAERSGPYPYHGAAGVLDHVDDYIFDGVFLLLGEDGSVMRENGLAVTQYVYGKFWVNNHAHVLQGVGPVSTEQAYLHFSFEPVAPLVTGAVQPKLSQSRMKCVPFLFAGDDICRAFAEIVQPWFAQLRSRTEETRILAEMRDELLPILVSGRLQVSIEDAPRLDARHPRRATSEGAA